jgi:two-component system, chemotaxis family, chemotaxis protein CheY
MNPTMQPTHHILVVDDSATVRRQTRDALEASGLGVEEASEGIEGLWRARQRRFDLVLVDVHMPAMDGIAMIRELRRLSGYERTPIFVLTTDSSADRAREGRSAGATAWMVKPPDYDVLVRGVRQMLGV